MEGTDLKKIYLTESKLETVMAPTTRKRKATTPCTATNVTNNIEKNASHSAASLDQMSPQELIIHTRQQEFCNLKPADNICGDVDLDHLVVRTT
jgi:hypothetical protein